MRNSIFLQAETAECGFCSQHLVSGKHADDFMVSLRDSCPFRPISQPSIFPCFLALPPTQHSAWHQRLLQGSHSGSQRFEGRVIRGRTHGLLLSGCEPGQIPSVRRLARMVSASVRIGGRHLTRASARRCLGSWAGTKLQPDLSCISGDRRSLLLHDTTKPWQSCPLPSNLATSLFIPAEQ